MIPKVIIVIVFLYIIPIIIGLPFSKIFDGEPKTIKLLFSYNSGFFVMLAIYEIVCMPMIFMNVRFFFVVVFYTVLLIAFALGVLWAEIRKHKVTKIAMSEELFFTKHKLDKYSCIYAFFFFVLLVIQIYGALNYSSTINSIDDSVYVTYSTDTITHDSMYTINVYTGEFGAKAVKRVLQVYNLFPAYISYLTGISVPTVTHTVLNVVFLLMAYIIYFIIAYDLFNKDMEEGKALWENVWIFLIFISLLYIFGYYSHFSISFRLLGVLWQGKAILSVIVTPFIFLLMRKFLTEEYKAINGLFLLLLCVASVSLSLMAVAHLLLGICLTTFIVSIVKKDWKKLLYVLWASIVPLLVGVVYLLVENVMR